MGKQSCRLRDNMENAFTKCSSGRGHVANFMGIQRETMCFIKILLRSSQFQHCEFSMFLLILSTFSFVSLNLKEGGTWNCNVNFPAVESKKKIFPVLRTPTSASTIALVRVEYRGQTSKVLCKFLSLRGSASHHASVFCVINAAQNKVWCVCLF